MFFILAFLKERSNSTFKQYGEESNENLIPLRERLEALLSSLLVNPSLKKKKKKKNIYIYIYIYIRKKKDDQICKINIYFYY